MGQKISDGKSWYPPLIHKLFSLPETFWNTAQKGSSTKFFGTVRQQFFYRKSWYCPLRNKIFRYRKFSETQHRRVPLRNFSVQWDNKFSIENRDIALLEKNFSIPEIFWNTAQKGFSTKFFGTVRQQIFYRKPWYSHLRNKIFRYPKFSETQKGSSTKFFGTVRRKFFNGKSWYPFA